MKPFHFAAIAAVLSLAACSGGSSGTSVAPLAGTNAGGASATNASASKSTVTLSITRASTTTPSAHQRSAQFIPSNAISVDAKVWLGSVASGTAVASSCVNFAANSSSATLSITVPQGLETMQITSYDGACTASGGQGTLGSGNVLSQFVGSGTVGPASTDVGTVFNSGTGITLSPVYYNNYYLPQSIASAFQYPSTNGYNGAGQTIGIVISSAALSTDYTTFLNYIAAPSTGRTITFVSVDSASTVANTSNGAFPEATLDLETIAGLATGANIRVYVTPDLSGLSLNDAYSQLETDSSGVSVVNMSYGGCEPASASNPTSTLFAAGAAAKIAFVASSGDQGSTCYNNGTQIPGVNTPAADPNVIGVGGNETDPSTGGPDLTNPVAWKDVFFGSPDGTGGGPSATFPITSWQSGIAGIYSSSFRNVPDVAMPAEGVAIYLNGAWQIYGGTSWSAPEISAQLAEIFQYCGGPVANPQEIPYVAHANNSAAFIDVTSGNNQYSPTTGSIAYPAGVGYDDTTGFGLPYGMAVAQAICPGHTPVSPLAAPHVAAFAAPAPAAPITFAAAPISGSAVIDMGLKSGSDPVTFQIGIAPTANVAGNEQAAVGILQAAGFTIVRTFPNHLIVDASGPSSLVASFFRTTMHNVNQGAVARYAPVGTITIPASLAPYASSVLLDNVEHVHTGPRPHL